MAPRLGSSTRLASEKDVHTISILEYSSVEGWVSLSYGYKPPQNNPQLQLISWCITSYTTKELIGLKPLRLAALRCSKWVFHHQQMTTQQQLKQVPAYTSV
jgi:hypothetical protein